MGRRPRNRAPKEGAQPPSLLSLPVEIRCMIWKAVGTCSGPILLCADSFTFGPLEHVAKFRFVEITPTQISKKKKHRSSKTKPPVHPFVWLLANRQIYAEAQQIFYANICLHFNDTLCLSAFMCQLPETPIKPSMVQWLSFDLKLPINADIRDKALRVYADHCDGFSFARSAIHGWEPTLTPVDRIWLRGDPCMCRFCLAAGNSIREDAAEYFTVLRELRLNISLICTNGPANERTMVGVGGWMSFGPGAQRYGRLIRPRDAPALVCKDNGRQIADFVEWVFTQAPLRVVSKVKLESVDVGFSLDNIEHDPGVVCERYEDRCWCKSRTIDKDGTENCGIAEEIKRRLISGHAEEGR